MFKSLIAFALICSTPFSIDGLLISQAIAGEDVHADSSVVTYDKEYFAKFDPVTLLDMLQRVPGVQAIIDKSKRTD